MKRLLSTTILLLSVCFSFAQTLSLSKKHGFCDEPFALTVTDKNNLVGEGATIRYTLDGSEPTIESTLYSGAIQISHNTVIRVAVVGADGKVSGLTTATYLFVDDVLKQSATPAGYPSTWGNYSTISGVAPACYGMSSAMAADPTLAANIKEGLKSLPVLSIVTDKDNLFSHVNDSLTGGIYIFTGPPVGDPTGNGWTRQVSAELFGDGHDLTVPCGLRLHGGHGRLAEKNPKHSFRLVFKKEYGQKTLTYPLFGEGEPNKFDQLVLRCHFGNSWQHWAENNRQQAQYTRDVWARRMQRKMGWTSVNALYVHLFLNGMYWGLYNIAERVNDQYGKDHLGGDKKNIDVVKIEEEGGNHHEAAEGDLDAWNLMVDVASKAYDDTYYYMLQGKDAEGNDDPEQEALLDIDNFIDYMLINQYGGNNDWDHHNWYAIRKKGADSQGFRFLCWDSELVIEDVQMDVLSKNNGNAFPTGIFNNLLRNDKFKKQYVSRAKKVLAADGLLGQESAEEVWDSLYNVISKAIYAEAARWGYYRRDIHPYQSRGSLYTVDDTYMKERRRLHTSFFPQRSSVVLNKINSLFYIDDFEAPAHWVPMTRTMFCRWNGSGKNATVIDANVYSDWNVNQTVSNGGVVAGFANVDHDTYADITAYDSLVVRGDGGNMRILANRLVSHGPWKELNVTFNSSNPYWDEEIHGLKIALSDIMKKNTSSNEVRVDDFMHLDAIKADWGNTIKVTSLWLVPSSSVTGIKGVERGKATDFNDDTYRNILGQKVSNPSRGIFIINGKKVLVR